MAKAWSVAAWSGAVLMTGCAEAPEPTPFEPPATAVAAPAKQSSGHGTAAHADTQATHETTPSTTKPTPVPSSVTSTTPSAAPSAAPTTAPKPAGKDNWEACTADAECGTKRCGCNGAAKMVCLPSADYPKTCVPPKANWAPCGSDAECATDRCGCNGGTEMLCLPTADYPKTCTAP